MPGWHCKNDDDDDDDDLQSYSETQRRQQSLNMQSIGASYRRPGSTHLAESRPSSGAAGRAENNSSTTTAADVSGAASASCMISRYECFWKDGECFVGVLAVTTTQPHSGTIIRLLN